MSQFLDRLRRSKHFRFGAPFFLFIFGGQYALRKFREVRYDSSINPRANRNLLSPEEAFADINQKAGKRVFEQTARSAEEELNVLDKKIDWDNWENKRGPRPWEGTIEKREVKRLEKDPVTVKELLGS